MNCNNENINFRDAIIKKKIEYQVKKVVQIHEQNQ